MDNSSLNTALGTDTDMKQLNGKLTVCVIIASLVVSLFVAGCGSQDEKAPEVKLAPGEAMAQHGSIMQRPKKEKAASSAKGED